MPASRSNRGVVVDDHLRTSADNVFALGECAEHRGICYGLVEPAYEQGERARAPSRIPRRRLSGQRGSRTNLKVVGRERVLGPATSWAADGSESILLSDVRRGTYKKLVIRGR